jgi:hypothetical protein
MSAAAMEMYRLLNGLGRARRQLYDHEIHSSLRSLQDVRTFMEFHAFAVWDFMCLLKTLQRGLTCVEVPWRPVGSPLARRLINEIVVEEESDVAPDGSYASHFELYREAMVEAGANTQSLDRFMALIADGVDVDQALKLAQVPAGASTFVAHTMEVAARAPLHVVAATFTFGREDPIPEMFRAIIRGMEQNGARKLERFSYYLERHIHVDEEHHSPLAVQMVAELCGADKAKWEEAREATLSALASRLSLWNAIAAEIAVERAGAPAVYAT